MLKIKRVLLAKENIQKLNHHHPFLHSLTFLDVLGLHSVEQLEEAQLSASYDPDPQKHLANTLTSCKRAFLLFFIRSKCGVLLLIFNSLANFVISLTSKALWNMTVNQPYPWGRDINKFETSKTNSRQPGESRMPETYPCLTFNFWGPFFKINQNWSDAAICASAIKSTLHRKTQLLNSLLVILLKFGIVGY